MMGHLLRDDTSALGSLQLRRAGYVVRERPHAAGMNTEHLTSPLVPSTFAFKAFPVDPLKASTPAFIVACLNTVWKAKKSIPG